ncbi:PTS system, lactose/cellobiose family IIC component [Enterococcus faecium EnGen0176]|uniref:PTS sugar transporter subunit IIC n=1 Tax=Enterococcus faecium TaxID=1352 RepID=UPI00032F0ACF|nr:PTS sugar transporter subunit IIC [Enterococcus faecium]EOG10773.1 PTS system, lactose/cellobiose family IIC component [Enterococcus faecium EnGen0176]EOM41453.1 PTS system, lactose/cellobiose family IIC component [Enterococcus faecium EnGen0173]RBS92578.1 PTS system, cellobiose-specific IIC component [Enterococcus faecium]RBS97202.1 PTS system, cellobiose-specific IIC component [Enterococcus faecium]HBK4033077.1 PTS sugar transporter subunit IIC [Enterococcus faecium]
MDKFIGIIEQKIMPVANRIGTQRHMTAIRKGIIATMPLTIVGSFFTILLNIPIESVAAVIEPYREILDIPFRYTVGILALYATFGIASSLAKSYRLDSLTAGILALMSFLIVAAPPTRILEDMGEVTAGRYINIANLGSGSLFGAIVTAIISVEIYRFFIEKKITIRMPDGVPPEVTNSFVALIPGAVILIFFWIIRHMLGFDLNGFLSQLLMPLKGVLAGNSLFGGLLTVFLICFFWVLGIHGPAIMGPVIRPFWDISIAENIDAFNAGTSANAMPNIFTEQFLQWFVWIGGAGTTLALVVLFMFSKSKYLKSLGRLSILPGLFNINEPMIFGAPVVMNPVLGIPFILAPLVTTTLSYILTVSGVVPMMVARLPFAMPTPIAAWMSTYWSIAAGLLVIGNFLITLAIYYPFFKVFEKQQLAREAEEQAKEQADLTLTDGVTEERL